MFNFWNNVSRYPGFFISTMFGLILTIINPPQNKRGYFLWISAFFILAICILNILKQMLDI